MNHTAHHLWMILALPGLLATTLFAQQPRTFRQPLGAERVVRVKLDNGYGVLHLRRTSTSDVYLLRSSSKNEASASPQVAYAVQDGQGVLRINMTGDGDGDLSALSDLFHGSSSNEWTLELTDRVPLELRLEFGTGEGDLDFTGLRLTHLSIEAGAGEIRLRTASPNPEILRVASISAGIGSLESSGLGNLRCQTVKFDGGIGSYVLDMTGDLPDRSSFDADIGMGSLELILPREVGVRLISDDSFLSSTSYPRFTEVSDGKYESANYGKAPKRMHLRIDTGMGSVGVRWK
jgi:hypothetical protein